MNFYASRDFLEAAAAVHFAGRPAAIENVRIANDILRLLVVDGKTVVTELPFLDFHQPLSAEEVDGPVRRGRYARSVARAVIAADAFRPDDYPLNGLAPYVDWSGFETYAAYQAWLLDRHRGMVRDRERRWRSLAAKHGEIVFTANDMGADVLPAARAWKSRQLAASGHPNWIEQPANLAFLQALQARGRLVSSTLRVGGRLASVWIGFIHEGVWSGWVFAFDPALHKFSVGHCLLTKMLEESFRLGHRVFDFSEGAEAYKFFYATHARVLGEVGRPPWKRALVVGAKCLAHRLGVLNALQSLKRQAGAKLRLQPVPEVSG